MIHSSRFTAVIDANVLYPIVIRDYLFWLAHHSLFTPKWSKSLMEEFIAIFESKGNLDPKKVMQQVKRMNNAFPDALVTNYEEIMKSIELKDKKDIHVLAAGIKCNANVIITNNLADFPGDYLNEFSLNAKSPDDFMADLIDLDPSTSIEAYRNMILCKNNPPLDEIEYLDILKKNNLISTADILRNIL
ncbi:MAG: PIN domain-containing protein [Fulvivirga sp.]|nr:PIN domain-containing protein [Fulvivirga sp.]